MESSPHRPRAIHAGIRAIAGEDTLCVSIRGECMMPWIENDSRVEVTSARYYWPGDIVVVLSRGGQYLAHRVIGLYRRSGQLLWLTQADSALQPDAAVPAEAILGKITGGSCHPHAIRIPLIHRLNAIRCFSQWVISTVKKRYVSKIG